MKIIEKYESIALMKNPINIGVGLGDSEYDNQKIIKISLDFVKKHKSKVYFFGKHQFSNKLPRIIPEPMDKELQFINTRSPGASIFEFLNNNVIHAIVRGSIGSSEFLKYFKLNLKVKEFNRLALLETYNGQQFFFGPVGIDECNNFKKKVNFLELAINELRILEILPNISILSGGRLSDAGRDAKVDKTLREAEKIVKVLKGNHPNLKISHDEILIEKAIKNKSNLIIAPDGISGNLIYRTLVHLGGGKAFGAIYMGNFKKIIIDTSRVGDTSEIFGALILAKALS
ncbi:MAG: methanogenesis marker protein Mmp4/MtxX [Candidatus Thorarchaeota archaeon]